MINAYQVVATNHRGTDVLLASAPSEWEAVLAIMRFYGAEEYFSFHVIFLWAAQ